MNKIEEIMEKINSIGREMVSDGSYKRSYRSFKGAALQLYLVRLLSTFICVELICAVLLLSHILCTCSSHSRVHKGFYVAASDKFVNVDQVRVVT